MRIIVLLCLIFLTVGRAHADDLRDRLQAVAAAEDPNYPDGNSALLTHFSVSCSLHSGKNVIHVVDQRTVIAGMLAPRGNNQISFYSGDYKFLGSLKYISSRPLWCEQAKLFLFGAWDGAMPGDTKCRSELGCNVIEWVPERDQFKLFHEKRYGSSGGIGDA